MALEQGCERVLYLAQGPVLFPCSLAQVGRDFFLSGMFFSP